MTIRAATPADHDEIARICLLTGNAGGDDTGRHGDDALLADVYAIPYLHGPAGFALVWDEGDGAIGYVMGTADTRAFQGWFSDSWWPSVAHRHPLRVEADESVLRSAADPERLLTAVVDDYPAHLHIDLLPWAQGKGAGRALIEAACALLTEHGVAGVHLDIDPRNDAARQFYPRVGFSTLAGQPAELFVRSLG